MNKCIYICIYIPVDPVFLGHDAVRKVLGQVAQLVHPLQPEVPVVEHVVPG